MLDNTSKPWKSSSMLDNTSKPWKGIEDKYFFI